jgi:hypothetical protein
MEGGKGRRNRDRKRKKPSENYTYVLNFLILLCLYEDTSKTILFSNTITNFLSAMLSS